MSRVEMYDPASRSWDRTCAATGVDREGCHACVTLGDHIYALGSMGRQSVNAVERYDARTNRWELRASMHESASFQAYAVLGDHIYATGGWGAHDRIANRVQRYDPARDCWDPVRDMPVDRRFHAAAVLDGCIYVIGGTTSKEVLFSSRVDRFDPTRDEWESVMPLAVGRRQLAAVTAGERIYAIGGLKAYRSLATGVEAYDAASNTWTACTPMPMARVQFGAAVLRVEEP